MIVAFLQNQIVAHDARTGRRLWSHRLSSGYDEHSCWPLYREPHLWISGPFNKGGTMLEMTDDSGEPVHVVRAGDRLSNDFFSSVLSGDVIYGFDVLEPQSSAHRSTRGVFRCLEWSTGRELWSAGATQPTRYTELPTTTAGEWPGHSSVMAVDGKLIVCNDLGELLLLRDSSERCEILARAPVLSGELCWTSPALSNGRLFVRNCTRAACVFLGTPERLSAAERTRALTVDDVPRGPTENRLAKALGLEARRELLIPTNHTLGLWFGQCLAVLTLAGVFVFGGELLFGRHALINFVYGGSTTRISPVGLVAAVLAPALSSLVVPPPWFTWPLAACLSCDLLIAGPLARWSATRWSAARSGVGMSSGVNFGMSSTAHWFARLRLAGVLAIAAAWVGFSLQFGFIFEAAFAAGVVGSVPVALFYALWIRPKRNGRSGRPAAWDCVVEFTRLIAVFVAFYACGAALLLWRASH